MAVTLAQPRGPSPSTLMEKLLIEGGVPLSGTIVPAGNKNAALPLLACSLLTDEEVVLHNVPRIRDVEAMLAPVLERQGYEVDRSLTTAERASGAARLATYYAWFNTRQALKRTPLGRRMVSLELFEPGAVKPPS